MTNKTKPKAITANKYDIKFSDEEWTKVGLREKQWQSLSRKERDDYYQYPKVAEQIRNDQIMRGIKKLEQEAKQVDQKSAGSSELVHRQQSLDVPQVIIGGLSTETLRQALQTQTDQRQLIKDFVQLHLTDGVDYGKIHVVSRDKCPDADRCKKSYHYSKPVLFKPGQEKLFSLFQVTAKLERDAETYEMLPDVKNLVAYKCILYRKDIIIGEGRGSATVGDNRRDANATIKIAEKRARMDACLSLGFSEYFAQDLDDPDYKAQADMANQRVAAEAEVIDRDEFGLYPRDPGEAMSGNEWSVLNKLLLQHGFAGKETIVAFFKANAMDYKNVTSGQARLLMKKINGNDFMKPPEEPVVENPDPIYDPNVEDIDIPITDTPAQPKTTSSIIEGEEIIIDNDFKSNLLETYNSLGLNARGRMWFFQIVSGRPFGDFGKMTDGNYRKAFNVIMEIMDGKLDVPEEYIAGVIDTVVTNEESQVTLDDVNQAFPGSEAV